MQRWRGLDQVPSDWGRCVVTIGVFDGVHRGHQELIGHAVTRARGLGVPCVLLTFDPHPSEVIRPGSQPARLTTLRRRAELVARLGVDVLCVLPFTSDLSKLTPEEFAYQVLVCKLHAAAVVVGENFTFGHKAAGTVETLGQLGSRFGFAAEGVGLLAASAADDPAAESGMDTDSATITFSSTYIRSCIDAGDVGSAAHALGRPHRLEGIVVRGDGRGRELGYPTANLSLPRYSAVPADGIYACRFLRLEAPIPEQQAPATDSQHGEAGRYEEMSAAPPLAAAVSVGSNPTFSGRERRVEAFVLDLTEDLYGIRVGLDFVARLRGMERYASSEQLVEAMDRDVGRVRELLETD